jgi:FRG domain
MLVSYMVGRANRLPFTGDHQLFESFFGKRAVYRGQARGWNIRPSGWRSTDPISDGRRGEVLYECLASYMGPEDAIEFELFGRVRSQKEADALGQHYDLPTNLVDFTFDPRVALYFACTDTASGPPPTELDSALADCGVVYFLSFVNLCLLGSPTVTFPPVHAERLYRQAGFFVNDGSRPSEIASVLNYQEPWMGCNRTAVGSFFRGDTLKAIS